MPGPLNSLHSKKKSENSSHHHKQKLETPKIGNSKKILQTQESSIEHNDCKNLNSSGHETVKSHKTKGIRKSHKKKSSAQTDDTLNSSSDEGTPRSASVDPKSTAPLVCVGHGAAPQPGKKRSEDVCIEEDVEFDGLHLSGEVLKGLHSSGFYKPSPVQLKAIPLGRCGLDLVVQAKSGTGKTCVFAVVALEMIAAAATTTQVLIVAPTREIAVQIASVMSNVGRHIPGLKVDTFIGGTTVERPGVCHIAVGTPGRLHHFLSEGLLSGGNVRLLVLDEADQLLDSFRSTVQQIIAALPLSKQVICASATYTDSLAQLAQKLMRSPVHVKLDSKQLLAVTQYVHQLPYTDTQNKMHQAKVLHLKGILGSKTFSQCLVFTNSVMKAQSVCDSLKNDGWPAACLSGGQTQDDRLKALDELVAFKCRVLVATDLAARGLDSPHVDLVISLDPPPHPYTYLHRVGRAGRYGSAGCSVVLAAQGDDWLHVRAIATVLNLKVLILPEPNLQLSDEDSGLGGAAEADECPHAALEVLQHLTEEQLQTWTKTTTHRLMYDQSSKNGEKYDPLEVWKVKAEATVVENIEKTKTGEEIQSQSIAINVKDYSAVVEADVRSSDTVTSEKFVSIPEELEPPVAVFSVNNRQQLHSTKVDSTTLTKITFNETSNDINVKKIDMDAQVLEILNASIVNYDNKPFCFSTILSEVKKIEENLPVSGKETTCMSTDTIKVSERDLTSSESSLLDQYISQVKDARKREMQQIDCKWALGNVNQKTALKAMMTGEDPMTLVEANMEKFEEMRKNEMKMREEVELVKGTSFNTSLKEQATKTEPDDFAFHMTAINTEKKLFEKESKDRKNKEDLKEADLKKKIEEKSEEPVRKSDKKKRRYIGEKKEYYNDCSDYNDGRYDSRNGGYYSDYYHRRYYDHYDTRHYNNYNTQQYYDYYNAREYCTDYSDRQYYRGHNSRQHYNYGDCGCYEPTNYYTQNCYSERQYSKNRNYYNEDIQKRSRRSKHEKTLTKQQDKVRENETSFKSDRLLARKKQNELSAKKQKSVVTKSNSSAKRIPNSDEKESSVTRDSKHNILSCAGSSSSSCSGCHSQDSGCDYLSDTSQSESSDSLSGSSDSCSGASNSQLETSPSQLESSICSKSERSESRSGRKYTDFSHGYSKSQKYYNNANGYYSDIPYQYDRYNRYNDRRIAPCPGCTRQQQQAQECIRSANKFVSMNLYVTRLGQVSAQAARDFDHLVRSLAIETQTRIQAEGKKSAHRLRRNNH